MIVTGTIVTTIVEFVEVDMGDQEIPEGEMGEMFMKVAMTLSDRKVVGKSVLFTPLGKLAESSGEPKS
jgi:hypothetical protein